MVWAVDDDEPQIFSGVSPDLVLGLDNAVRESNRIEEMDGLVERLKKLSVNDSWYVGFDGGLDFCYVKKTVKGFEVQGPKSQKATIDTNNYEKVAAKVIDWLDYDKSIHADNYKLTYTKQPPVPITQATAATNRLVPPPPVIKNRLADVVELPPNVYSSPPNMN